MIVHAFISRNDDWCLAHHLEVFSRLADRIVCVLDRSPSSEPILARYHKAEVIRWQGADRPDHNENGVLMDEGAMRQVAWDAAMQYRPDLVLLADTDEVPTPDVAEWLEGGPNPAVDCWYADWVNLWNDAGHAIGGNRNVWSFQVPTNNKKGLVVRPRGGRAYRYRLGDQHVRMEPNPLHEGRTVIDDTHRMGPAKLVHYKYGNRRRWLASPLSLRPKYLTMIAGGEIVPVPQEWLWRWDADELLRGLPEPVAVVGNGPIKAGKGPLIDSCPTVIRFNNFRTEGFEHQVGRRTDVWCVGGGEDVARREWTGPMITTLSDAEDPDRLSVWLAEYPHVHTPRESWAAPLRREWGQDPSCGLMLLNRLREMGKRIHAFGFDGNRNGHYWDRSDRPIGHRNEKGILAAIEGAGVEYVG